MKRALHVLFVIAVLFLGFVLPFLTSDTFAAIASGNDADAVSSATVVLDQPSGEYVVFLNRAMHEEAETLAVWTDFFRGEDIGIVFEDLSCVVPRGDAAGLEMARSLASRLPENQMTVRTEDAVLCLSKAEYGRCDVLVLSREAANAYGAESLADSGFYEVIELTGEAG